MTGTSSPTVVARSSCVSGWVGGEATGSRVPRWPPAAGPCAATASTPIATASSASAKVVTVPIVVMPALRSVAHSAASGSPNVNDTTSGFRSITTSNFAAHWSSS